MPEIAHNLPVQSVLLSRGSEPCANMEREDLGIIVPDVLSNEDHTQDPEVCRLCCGIRTLIMFIPLDCW